MGRSGRRLSRGFSRVVSRLVLGGGAKAAFKIVDFLLQAGWKAIAEFGEMLADKRNFSEPSLNIDVQKLVEIGPWKVETFHVQIAGGRQAADRRFDGIYPVIAAFEYPFEHAAVFPVAGPQKLSVFVRAKPIDVENFGKAGTWFLSNGQVVRKIVSHVVAAEGEH